MFGLSFLNTLFLWGLAAASLPIIIHLIRRSRAIKVPFAAIRFLEASPKKTLRQQKLRQLLLLLMRILALALLALAFARPFFEKAPPVGLLAETPKAMALLLDHSLSMTAEGRLQEAAAAAQEILQEARPGDFVAVLRFASTAEVMVEEADNPRTLSTAVSSWLQPSYGSTQFRQALQTAENLLQRSLFPDKTIYLISDLEGSPEKIEGDSYRLAPGIRLDARLIGQRHHANAAVTALRLPKESDEKPEILAHVQVTGDAKKAGDLLEARLVLDGRTVQRRQVRINERGEGVARFTRFPSAGRVTIGYIEIDPIKSSVAGDDRRFFVLRTRGKIRVLAVDGEPDRQVNRDELFFVDRAFNLPGGSPFELESVSPNRLTTKNLTDYHLIVLANVRSLTSDAVDRLKYFVRTGGGLLITLGDQVRPPYLNRALDELLPGNIGEPRFGLVSRSRSVLLAQADYYHPIFRPFEDPGHGDLASARFYQYAQVTPNPSAQVLAHFDDGGPAVLERMVGEGKVILYASSIDNEWTDLPVKPIFLPLLYETARHLAPAEGQQTEVLVGQPLLLGAAADAASTPIRVRTPSGQKMELSGEAYFARTTEPGIYEIRVGQEIRYFAVNVDPAEAVGEPIDSQRFVDHYTNPETETPGSGLVQSSEAVQKEVESRQHLWRYLLFAVTALLVGETFLANRTFR